MSEEKVKVKIHKGASAKITFPKIEVELPDGSIVEKDGSVFICRCGKSSNQPFCDGTHKTCEFES